MSDYVLEVVEGPEAGKRIPLPARSVEIGRERNSEGIALANDDLISRRHARLTPTPDGLVVEDLGSSNGTFVNGGEIHSSAVLTPGNEITVGVTVLQVRTAAQAAAATAVRAVPAGLTYVREAPRLTASEPPMPVQALAAAQRSPDFLPPDLSRAHRGDSILSPLLDAHTKRMARTAPLAIFVLVALVVIIGLALR